MNSGQAYGTWDVPTPKKMGNQRQAPRSNNASKLSNEISRMRMAPTSRNNIPSSYSNFNSSIPPPPPPQQSSSFAPPRRSAPPAPAPAYVAPPQSQSQPPRSSFTAPAQRPSQRPVVNPTRSQAGVSMPVGQGVFASGRAGTSAVKPSSNPLVTTPMRHVPAPTSMGGSIPFQQTTTNVNQSPAEVVRDMRRAERQQAQTKMDNRVRRQSYLREAPSADASKELHRRNASPGYMASRVIQGVDWNRDAFLSQQAYNHAMSVSRKEEKLQVAQWHSGREGGWHTDTGTAAQGLEEKVMPIHSRGVIPTSSGAASTWENEKIDHHNSQSKIEQQTTLKGRYKDEDKLLRIFRSYDTRFDGAISQQHFRSACRYLGIEQA